MNTKSDGIRGKSKRALLRSFIIAVGGYCVISVLILWAFSAFGAPFIGHQVSVQGETAIQRFWNMQTASVVMLIEVGVILLLTRGYRKRPHDLLHPPAAQAKRELALLVTWLVAVQLLGFAVGKLLGWHPISFHLAGSMYGTEQAVQWPEIFGWMGYNFLMYVLVPVLYFWRLKRYSLKQLNIISNRNIGRDISVILIVLMIEIAIQLGGVSNQILHLPWQQGLQAGLIAFAVNLIGTALPTAIFIYALMFSRFVAVFKNPVVVIVLGGLTYMTVHFFDYWMVFGSVGAFAASFGALFLQYFMPGVIKSVLTYRTGNPWVHLWAYHAIAPHVVLDTPHFVDMEHGAGGGHH